MLKFGAGGGGIAGVDVGRRTAQLDPCGNVGCSILRRWRRYGREGQVCSDATG
jgi:hypothetical protein